MNQTDGNQPTILVAEDDEDNRLVMKMLLELRGYRSQCDRSRPVS